MKCFTKAQNSVTVCIDSMLPIYRESEEYEKTYLYYTYTDTYFFSKLVMIVASKEGNGVLEMGMEKGLHFEHSLYHLNSVQYSFVFKNEREKSHYLLPCRFPW